MKTNREELLKTAFCLFMNVNYEKASLSELGKLLGIAKTAVFKYYPDKQTLFIAVTDRFLFHTQTPQNKFIPADNQTFTEFIDEYALGVKRTMDAFRALINSIMPESGMTCSSGYFNFLAQVRRYYPHAEEKLHTLINNDYDYWCVAIRQAIANDELKADTDIEEAAALFQQVYHGLSLKMSFFQGLDTELLAKRLHYVYSLLKV